MVRNLTLLCPASQSLADSAASPAGRWPPSAPACSRLAAPEEEPASSRRGLDLELEPSLGEDVALLYMGLRSWLAVEGMTREQVLFRTKPLASQALSSQPDLIEFHLHHALTGPVGTCWWDEKSWDHHMFHISASHGQWSRGQGAADGSLGTGSSAKTQTGGLLRTVSSPDVYGQPWWVGWRQECRWKASPPWRDRTQTQPGIWGSAWLPPGSSGRAHPGLQTWTTLLLLFSLLEWMVIHSCIQSLDWARPELKRSSLKE